MTCEVCHGPGSGYRKLNIMQDEGEGGPERTRPLSRRRGHRSPLPQVPSGRPRRALRLQEGLGHRQASRPRQVTGE
ncbi:MAG: hypothetical protein M0C28_45435 [Candidatus Moduliflexus flocculans]|nr:hypothetical protein [Candidatus Moduliflexus flocculans]